MKRIVDSQKTITASEALLHPYETILLMIDGQVTHVLECDTRGARFRRIGGLCQVSLYTRDVPASCIQSAIRSGHKVVYYTPDVGKTRVLKDNEISVEDAVKWRPESNQCIALQYYDNDGLHLLHYSREDNFAAFFPLMSPFTLPAFIKDTPEDSIRAAMCAGLKVYYNG